MAEAERNFTVHRLLARWDPNYNLAPTQLAPVIHRRDGKNIAELMRFGLVPHFAHGIPPSYSTINATVERLESGPVWRRPWRHEQRCLVLAAGFYEWHVSAVDRGKQPYFIRPADQSAFAFAGLWDASIAADGSMLYSFAIITLPASPLMAQIHNSKGREPAILPHNDLDVWLSGSAGEAHAALRPYPDNLLSAHPVSRRVNSPKNNDAMLTEAVPVAVDDP